MLISLKNRSHSFLFFILLLILLTFSYAIVHQNFIMFVPAVILLGFLVIRSNFISIFIILFFVFFGNSLANMGLLPLQANWLVEVIIILLFIKAVSFKIFRKEKIQLNYLWIVFLFLSVTAISYMFNNTYFVHTLLFLRLLFRYYLLFLSVINLDFEEKSIALINNVIIVLFIIQIPTAVVKMFIYGQGEFAIGTYAPWGGGPSTVIPMIAISYLVAFYFYYKPSKLYFLLALGFIAFGLIGGKRAIIIFVPIVIIFIGIYMKNRLKNAFKYFFVGGIIILLTIFSSIKLLPSLNPQHRIGGEIDLRYMLAFLSDYTLETTYEGASAGRISTTINVFNILKKGGLENLCYGFGPGSYIETMFESLKTTLKETHVLPIQYGTTGLSWLALQTGYIGALIYLFLFYMILVKSSQYFRLEDRSYWKSFGLGMIGFSFVMIFISVSYNSVFIDDMIPMVYFLLVAFTMKIKNSLELRQLITD